jgi:hypothetical protein
MHLIPVQSCPTLTERVWLKKTVTERVLPTVLFMASDPKFCIVIVTDAG